MNISEADIRNAVRSRAVKYLERSEHIRLVEELELGNCDARIDMAFFGNELLGIEIKSPRDTLKRLPDQASHYSKVFDRVILVADQKFLDSSLDIIPSWWGVVTVLPRASGISFRVNRRPLINPNVEESWVLKLLWKGELVRFLEDEKGLPVQQRDVKQKLRSRILDIANKDEVKKFSLEAFKTRGNWRCIDFVGT